MTKEEIDKELELEDYDKYERINHDFKFWLLERLGGCTILAISVILGLGLLCCIGVVGMLAVKVLMWFYGLIF